MQPVIKMAPNHLESNMSNELVISSGSPIVRAFRLQSKSQDQHEVKELTELEADVVVDVRNWNLNQEFEDLEADTVQPTLIGGKRKRQNVSTKLQRRQVVSWMVNDQAQFGKTNLMSRTIERFDDIFTGSYKANIQKASRWWKDRERIMKDTRCSITRTVQSRRVKVKLKARAGRGRKRAEWIQWLFEEMIQEFNAFLPTQNSF